MAKSRRDRRRGRGGLASQEQRQQVSFQSAQISQWQGAFLPPPEMLAGYEALIPEGAAKIFALAELQTTHRHNLENRALWHEIIRSYLGLATAALIALAILGVSAALISAGHDAAGAAVGGIDIVGIVAIFIYGTASQRSERIQKTRILSGRNES